MHSAHPSKALSKAEIIYLTVALIFYSGGLILAFYTPISVADRLSSESISNVWQHVLGIPLLTYGAYHILKRPKKTIELMHKERSTGAILLLAAASAAWSIDVSETIQRTILIIAITLSGVAIAMRLDQRETVKILTIVFFSLTVIQLLSAIAIPSKGIHQDVHYPAVRGLFAHKNFAGRTLLVGVIASLCYYNLKKPTYKRAAILAFCTLGALATLSVTVYLTIMAVALTAIMVKVYKNNKKIMSALVVATSLVAVFIYFSGLFAAVLEPILNLFGRDLTLTTRTLIWSRLWEASSFNDIILGYGYEAFFNSPNGVSKIWNEKYFLPAHAHNGFIHTTSGIGAIGTLLIILSIIKNLSISIKSYSQGHKEQLFSVIFLVFFIITNAVEPSILRSYTIIWIIYVCVSFQNTRFKDLKKCP